MVQTKLHIELLDSSENALSLIYSACRQCYSPKFSGQLFKEGLGNLEGMETFVKQIVASGHESPLEHVKFTFGVEGVSRALTHQLVRHRIASYSQQSQRYVKASDFTYVIPPLIEQDAEMKQEYISIMEKIQDGYNRLLEMFEAKNIRGESAKQDARFLLPQGIETKIVLTMNCRELIHFFQQRCCSRAQWEIRNLAEEMLSLCKQKLPEVFNNSGAKCVSLGYCPEGEKFTCGKYPLQKKL